MILARYFIHVWIGVQRAGDLKKKVANVEIYVIFEVFAFCGGRTKTDFKDRGLYIIVFFVTLELTSKTHVVVDD